MTNEIKYKGQKHQGPDHQSPYPLSRMAPRIDLVEIATEIADADDMLAVQATGKLRVLAEQIEKLQDKAREILTETRRNQELHRAHCSFKKICGRTYHLYKKKDASLTFSLIGPQEWHGRNNNKAPFQFIGSYRLEKDSSWTPVDKKEK